MKKSIICFMTVLAFLIVSTASAKTEPPKVKMETTKGTIILELDPVKAPKTVANFLTYVKSGFFSGTVFHRVIKGFMIQGGGLTADLEKKNTIASIKNEADNGLKNNTGTIAMARTNDPHSATSQFFINTADNASLNHRSKTGSGWGYCVFGKVVEGMDVVKAIEGVKTTFRAGRGDVPVDPITIKKVTLIEPSMSEKEKSDKTKEPQKK